MSGVWRAGAATAPFPVPVGVPMAGYMARTGPATGTRDGLTIGALALESGNGRLVVVAADIAGVDAALVDGIARAAEIDRSELVLCASHTHSGPAGVTARLHPADDDRSDPRLRANFVTVATAAIAEARRRLEPVELVFGAAETHGLAANRNAADGPFDPTLSVLAARRPNGEIATALVHFACHPTILGADNRLISADFPGALRAELASALGARSVVLYGNGAAGDVSTRFTRTAQDGGEVQRVGVGVAAAALTAMKSAIPVKSGIRHARTTIELPPRTLEAASTIAGAAGSSTAERRKAETRVQGAALLDKLIAAGETAIPASLELDAWLLGDLALVAVPGELFASLGARIVAESRPALVLGYGNGYAGYLADEAAYAEGTYEVLASPFAPGAGERVATAAIRLIADLRGRDHA